MICVHFALILSNRRDNNLPCVPELQGWATFFDHLSFPFIGT